MENKIDWLPTLCYFALVAAYLVTCYIAPTVWYVAAGFALGVLSSWRLDWKRSRAFAAMLRAREVNHG